MAATVTTITNNEVSNDSVTAFLNEDGINAILRLNGKQVRFNVPYSTLTAEIEVAPGQKRIALVEFTAADDVLVMHLGSIELDLVQQPKGQFFSWLKPMPKSKPITMAEARKKAGKDKPAAAAAPF